MSSRIAEMVKEYENVDISKSVSAVLKAAYTPFKVSESYKQSMESFEEIGRQFSAINIAEESRRSLDSIQNIAKLLISVSTIDTARSIQNLQESMITAKFFLKHCKKTELLTRLSMQHMNLFKKRISQKM